MRVAITGASGFVGRALGERLRALGWTVHGYDLHANQELAGPVTRWDIAAGPLPGAPEVDAVVHCAAVVAPVGGLELSRAVNVTGTTNVAATFPRARFVHLSSCSVYDPWQPQVMAKEDEAPAPDAVRWTNAYGRTKAEAEAWLRANRPGAVVLRPHAIYGRGDTTLLPRLRAGVRHGAIPIAGSGEQLHSVTWVQNLVEACRSACLPEAPAGVYNIADPEPVVLAEAMAYIACPPGGPLPTVRPLPAGVLMPVATVAEWVARARTALTGRQVEPRISRYTVEHVARERTFDLTRAREQLGSSPAPSCYTEAPGW